MTIANQTGRGSSITGLSIAGAICYVVWGGLHLQAAYAIHATVARPCGPGSLGARLDIHDTCVFQDGRIGR
jgi:hypothetical protein